jgi:hypothetical protein
MKTLLASDAGLKAVVFACGAAWIFLVLAAIAHGARAGGIVVGG